MYPILKGMYRNGAKEYKVHVLIMGPVHIMRDKSQDPTNYFVVIHILLPYSFVQIACEKLLNELSGQQETFCNNHTSAFYRSKIIMS